MSEQLACFFSDIEQVSSVFRATLSGQQWSGSIELLPDGTGIPVMKDFIPGDDDLITVAGLTVVYVWADETVIDTINGNAAYHLFWRIFTDDDLNPTLLMPADSPVVAELAAFRDYIVVHTGKTNATILQWFANHFNTTKAEAIAWATSRERYRTVNKMLVAMQRWSDAKNELDAIEPPE